MSNEFIQVATIAGSDSDGSAGAQADLHSFFARGVYGTSILVAAVAGNSYAIHDAHPFPVSFINSEFKALADDYQIRAIKTGMLANEEIINCVADNLEKYHFGPLILDPVIMTKFGDELLEADAYETLKNRLIPLAEVITPNFFEQQKLAELTIQSDEDVVRAARKIKALGAKNIVAKGRKYEENQTVIRDFVILADGTEFWLEAPFYKTNRINGTGDTLSAIITAEIAKGESVEQAIRTAKAQVTQAIAHPIAVGHQFGPINHWQIES